MTESPRHVLTNAPIVGGLRAWAAVIAVLALAAPAPAQLLEELPEEMQGVGIVFSRILEIPSWMGVIVGMVIVAFFAWWCDGYKSMSFVRFAWSWSPLLLLALPCFACCSSSLRSLPLYYQ